MSHYFLDTQYNVCCSSRQENFRLERNARSMDYRDIRRGGGKFQDGGEGGKFQSGIGLEFQRQQAAVHGNFRSKASRSLDFRLVSLFPKCSKIILYVSC